MLLLWLMLDPTCPNVDVSQSRFGKSLFLLLSCFSCSQNMTCNLLLPILAWIIRTSHTASFICLLVPNQQLAFGTCACLLPVLFHIQCAIFLRIVCDPESYCQNCILKINDLPIWFNLWHCLKQILNDANKFLIVKRMLIAAVLNEVGDSSQLLTGLCNSSSINCAHKYWHALWPLCIYAIHFFSLPGWLLLFLYEINKDSVTSQVSRLD